jgi:hypothetical protein
VNKETVLNQITLLRSLGDRDGAVDMWSKHKNIISQSEFEQAYGKGLEAFYEKETA